MILKIEKSFVVLASFILILGCILISCLILGGNSINAEAPLKGKTIVIDAGHGGLDGGAVATDGTCEKEINLNIALFLKNYLEKSGCKVILTRDKDISLHTHENASVKEKKREDLENRKRIANTSDGDMLISIHLNHFQEEKYHGAQVFYENTHPESNQIALALQKALIENLDKNNNREAHKLDTKKILFENIKIPGVIVECGFLSNLKEAESLKNIKYQEKIAYSVYKGILNYFIG